MHPDITNLARCGRGDNDNNVKGGRNNDKNPSSSHVIPYITGNNNVAAAVN